MSIPDLLQRAQHYWRTGKAITAERIYEWILTREPENAQAHFGLGLLYLEQGDYSRSESHFRGALKAHPGHAQISLHLAQLLYACGQYEDAVACCEEALKHNATDEALEFERLKSLVACNRLEEASREQQAYAARFPQSWKPEYIKGALHHKDGQLNPATVSYLRAHQAASTARDPRLSIAQAFFEQKKYDWAAQNVSNLIEQNPRDVDAILLYARIMRALKKPDARREALERAVAVQPEAADTLAAYAELLMEENPNNARDALAYAQSAHRASPKHPIALYVLSLAYEKLGHRSRAMQFARASLAQTDARHVVESFARLMLPGCPHRDHLKALHAALSPKRYIEIGIGDGASLALTRQAERCIGIDPQPRVRYNFHTSTRIYPMSTDVFFEKENLAEALGGLADMILLGGSCSYRETLEDIRRLELHAHPETLLLIRGSYPLDDALSSSQPHPRFWCGDGWKCILILRELCPDISLCTLPSHPAGLTLVRGIDRLGSITKEQFEEVAAKYDTMKPSEIPDPDGVLNIIENDTTTALMALKEGAQA